jgi:hypothetical protein
MHVFGGSNVTLRDSVILSNAANGVMVSTDVVATTRNNSLANIDLGNVLTTSGKNTLQASTLLSGENVGSGVCMAIDPGAGQTLLAEGNTFAGPRDCSQPDAGIVTLTANACGPGKDIGFLQTIADGGSTGNNINVTNCTHP